MSDPLVERWVNVEFANPNTRKVYRTSLKKFADVLNIPDFKAYLEGLSAEKALEDIKRFLNVLNGSPSCTISSYLSSVKVFLKEQGIGIEDGEFRKLKSRGFAPKRVSPKTRDRAPTLEEVRKILDYMDVKGRALVLFLLSSGCRIGETCQLKISDLNLKVDPPEAFIRGESSKAGVGERYVFFSNEAKDAISNWLQVKATLTKRHKGGGSYGSELVFPFTPGVARFFLRRALKKAGLDQKDPETNIGILHVHSFRKFFRTNIGLNIDEIHALMGHLEYLDSNYLRLNKEQIAQNYKKNVSRVSVYSMDQSRLSQLEQRITEREGIIQALLKNGESKESEIAKLRNDLNVMVEQVQKNDELLQIQMMPDSDPVVKIKAINEFRAKWKLDVKT